MERASAALPAHSLAEACLYVSIARCRPCGSGPLRVERDRVRLDPQGRLSMPARCQACGHGHEFAFQLHDVDAAEDAPAGLDASSAEPPAAGRVINPTDEHSRIIDVAGWLLLYGMLLEEAQAAGAAAKTADDRIAVRHTQIQAGQCLEEALKFYEPDNDLPPSYAFYRRSSRRQFRDRPELFARQRLIDLRAKLPIPRPPAE